MNGGLGNQMFQYALGRSLAIKNNTVLKLEISELEVLKDRKYLLDNFNIKAEMATSEEVMSFTNSNSLRNLIFKFQNKLFSKKYYEKPIVIEQYYHFDENILRVHNNSFLKGYWQCERYFLEYKDQIQSDFTVKNKPNEVNAKMIEKIQKCNAVSLHVRRGDYVSNKSTNVYHGTCSIEYYRKCIDYINKKVNNPVFFVFSDDYEWTKRELPIKGEVYYMEHNSTETPYEDIRLMYNCKHFIIANSSLSWWGAWLGRNKDKIVLAPQKWFNNSENNTKDILPKSWIKI